MTTTPKRSPPTCITYEVSESATYLCIGSDCNRFVPEVTTPGGHNPRLREPNDRDVVNTGLGVCADNLRAEPWVDVAGVKS
jgi:hypothetical protein